MKELKELYDLTGMVALITGAGNGIGKASALMLSHAGASVICADLNKDFADETAKEIEASGGKSVGIQCDVTSEESLENLAKEAIEAMGKINILVNNAGGGGGGKENFDTLTYSYIEKIYRLNVFSIFKLSELCIPHIPKDEHGAIVNISSMASMMATHNMSVYGSSKAAVNQLTKYMAVDLAPHIRVNAVAPGAIKTRALATVLTPEIEEKMLRRTPMKSLGEADDIALTVLFLASPVSRWITGQVIAVNGGGEQDLD